MAALVASELKYGNPVKVAVGALWFTATQVEIPSGKEYTVGSLELNLKKLGLTNGAIAGTTAASYKKAAGSAIAATTALPGAIWCSPVAAEATTENEAAKEVATGLLAQVAMVGKKAFLRFYGLTTAGDGKPVNEAKTATKVTAAANLVVTVYAFGK